MKTIGLIGGTGWVSTLEYYRAMNEAVNRRLGGHEACRILMYSFNFGDIMRAKEGDPHQREVGKMVLAAAVKLASIGAEGILLCANTLHWFADEIERTVPVPLIHIARATAVSIRKAGLSRVGLLGTLPTMEQNFYRDRLQEAGIETLVPEEDQRHFIHDTIFQELIKGDFKAESRSSFLRIIESLRKRGAQGVVLGCTEIPLLLKQEDCPIPLFDTLGIHVDAGVDFALSDRIFDER